MAYKIVIIDDEKEISSGFAQFFPWAKLGYQVVAQYSGAREALEYLLQNPVDVVVSDIRMPGMTGIDLARELFEAELAHKPRSLLFSAYEEFEYARKALQYKCTDYLLKSTDYEEL
ncbi:MAG: response regulator, partial [Oscillospiraceae bacterium]